MSRILVTQYYYDFARFFYSIEKQIESQSSDVQFINLCYYPGSYIYYKTVKENAVYLPYEVRKHNYKTENKFSESKLSQVLNFNIKALKINGAYNSDIYTKLKNIANNYFNYFYCLFKENKIDLFISSGDTRLVSEIALFVAKEYNIPILYFEQGPYRTTILDKNGVNANIKLEFDLESTEYEENWLKNYFANNKPKERFMSQDKIYKIASKIDYLLCKSTVVSKPFIPVEFYFGEKLKIRKHRKKTFSIESCPLPEKYVLLILQVPVDAQMICHSPLYDNFYEMVKDVYSNVPKEYQLVIREHPNHIGEYETEMYEFIRENNIIVLNNMNLNKLIDSAEIVIVNNSMVGLDSLIRYKTCVVLGNTYYKIKDIVYTVDKREDIKDTIKIAINRKIPNINIEKFLCYLFKRYLIQGHFLDKDLSFTRIIANKIVKEYLQ